MTSLPKVRSLDLIVVEVIAILVIVSAFNFFKYSVTPKNILGATDQFVEENNGLKNELSFWQHFLAKYPNYLEGWVQVSKLSNKLNLSDISNEANLKIKEIDPNFSNEEL